MSGSPPVAVTRMTFDDEFNSFVSSADGSSGWMTRFPYGGEAAYTLAGNSEAEYYGSSTSGLNPFSLQNGVLNITATPAYGSNPYGLPYNSGLITTDTSFSQTYGYFEVNAQLPAGQGLWPAFWLLPASNVYTSELDVFEQLGNAPSTIYSTVHGTTNGVWAANSQAFAVPNTATGFHTYGVDWEPATTTYFVDGVAIGSAPTPSSMNSPMFMLLNLAVGAAGSWPGAVSSATTLPASLQIDYVHAYATAGTTFVGGPSALPAAPAGLVLHISEDAWLGDAQYTVSVDGVQQGGVRTASASHAAGSSQAVSIAGSWNAGAHVVAVTFLNDAYGGSAATDRNLHVDGVSLDGVAAGSAPQALLSDGTATFTIAATTSATTSVAATGATVVGTGADTLALVISEDAYQGDAQFTVAVNGVQQGGTLVARATNVTPGTPLYARSQVFDIEGSFTGSNVVTVSFLNDLYGGSASADRNLFVLGATIDGTAIAGSTLTENSNGPQSFGFTAATAAATAVSGSVTAGTGAETLALVISEDAYLGDAQFTVSINGVQQGGTLVASAANVTPGTPLYAQSQVFDIAGSFAGSNVVTVTFLNDLYGGSVAADRNLFVLGATINGTAIAGSKLTEDSSGPQSFGFTEPAAPITPGTTAGSGIATALMLNLSEDSFQGDAQFVVAVDGVQLGSAQSVTTQHGGGGFQAFGFTDTLAAGTHDVAVSFLNDLYGGSSSMDRNLYVNGASVNGVAVGGAASALLSSGTNHFGIVVQ